MKIRTAIFWVGFVLIAIFGAINLNEILRTTTINLGLSKVQAPLGLVLLSILVVVSCFFLVTILMMQTAHLYSMHQVNKEAKEQRGLADSAEQSRFTQLLQKIQTLDLMQQQREETKSQEQLARITEFETNLSNQLMESSNGLAASVGEMEDLVQKQFKILT